jgi:diguanylate cyclase (GGDEF)-like protein
MHEETLNQCNGTQIDLPNLTSKFNEIQMHMTQEVQKANTLITQLTQQVKKLEEKSNLDALTKVLNRHALINYLDDVCLKKELSYSFHMLILDIDDFKNINDTYGHVAGDKVLIFIANILRKTLRDGDKVFRYGGEEFIIILNRVDDKLCRNITERLLNLIRKNKLIYKGENLNVTMSIGTTKYKQADTPETLMTRADKALYIAKKNGKNQMYSEN